MPSGERPQRTTVVDETGSPRALGAGPETFASFGRGPDAVFLGLGPDPAVAVGLAAGRPAAFVECPAFAVAMPPQWPQAIPADWERLEPEALSPARAARSTFYLYRQNTRLFPSFWGPIWARAQLAILPRPETAATTPAVLLARRRDGLLEPEIARALAACGRPVTDIPAEASGPAVARVLAGGKPSLFLCINGAGLDDDGLLFSLLAEAGVPAAIWFVDNPFHVLGRFRGPFWKKARLFATDETFLAPLRSLGAPSAVHLPLAAADHFFTARPEPGLADRALFVGRSAFAGREQFFAGCRVPADLLETARSLVAAGGRPDFFWWRSRLGDAPLWPGKAGRTAGLGAETASLDLRAGVLAALAEAVPLSVYGDPGWQALLPESAALNGPVDYYGRLAGLYAGAGVTANVTSLLLPGGLTQRHFDVWAAGGCLLTDATPGLPLFPARLTAPVTYATPTGAASLARTLLADPGRRAELAAVWRRLMASEHRYEHRLALLLDRSAA
jgi:hypothetical protein